MVVVAAAGPRDETEAGQYKDHHRQQEQHCYPPTTPVRIADSSFLCPSPPLQLMMDNTLSQSSDVYSFAIIMFELLTFRIPFDNLGKEQVRRWLGGCFGG